MKIVVDFDLCQSHSVCVSEAPEVFKVDENGYLAILQESPDEGLREKVETAAKYCPTGAISIVED